jgi:cytochrome c biogenesis protein CcmG/thiol:disulfide interchange protein DsbE
MKFQILFAVSLFFTVSVFGAGSRQMNSRTAPLFNLPTQTGSISLDAFRGKVVYVDFWASWCIPCRQSFPWMKTMYEKYSAQGFEIIAINLDKKTEDAEEFISEFFPPFTIAFDPEGKIAEAYDVPTMPSSFLINREGMIVYSHAGFDSKKTEVMENIIKEECSK